LQPVETWLLMRIAIATCREPCAERLVKTSDAFPVHEGAGIEEDNCSKADRDNGDELRVGPALWRRLYSGCGSELMRSPCDRHSQRGATYMDNVSLLRQDHTK